MGEPRVGRRVERNVLGCGPASPELRQVSVSLPLPMKLYELQRKHNNEARHKSGKLRHISQIKS